MIKKNSEINLTKPYILPYIGSIIGNDQGGYLKPNKAGYEKKARTDQHGYEL
jgi:hypothetical protein